MPSDNKYSIDLIWSNEDGMYLAQVKELPGCLADGATAEEAFQNLRVIIDEWLDTAREEKREIPPPLTIEALEIAGEAARQQLQKQMAKSVRDTVINVLQKMEQEKSKHSLMGWPEGRLSRFNILEKEKT